MRSSTARRTGGLLALAILLSVAREASAQAPSSEPAKPPEPDATPAPTSTAPATSPPATAPPPAAPPTFTPPGPPEPPHEGEGPHGRHHEHRHDDVTWAGFGYTIVGFMTGGFSALERSLQQGSALGGGYAVAPTGVLIGGGGGFLLGRLWLGGKGFGLFVHAVDTDTATVSFTSGGGGGELGYAAIATRRWLVIPFMGFGGFGSTVKLHNTSASAIPIYPKESLPAGSEAEYTTGFMTAELGLRAQRLFALGHNKTKAGGFIVGAEVGYLSSLQRAGWVSNRGVPSSESAELRGGYFRLVIGGGSVYYKDE